MKYSDEELTGLERSVVSFYSILNIALFIVAEQLEWGNIVSLLYLLSIFSMWFISLNHYFDHKIRSFLFTSIMQIGIIILMAKSVPFEIIVSMIMCMTVLAGLFGVKELIILTGFVSLLVAGFETATNLGFHLSSPQKSLFFILQLLMIAIVEYSVYFWVKKREDTRIHIEETIRSLHVAEQSKTDFLCNVSHELRTPINSICGISEIASKENSLENVREEIVQMKQAGKRLLSVVSDILDFSELQSGKMDVEEEVYSLTTTIQDIMEMTYSLKEEKKIEVLFNIDANLPKLLLGDEKKIRRIVLNLASNAIKFTNEGYISIGISSRKEDYGVNLCIEIKDTGIGMKEEDQEKLFTDFAQIDSSRKRAVGGIGLGLSISQMLARKMGGIISVKSKAGKGTSIQVVIPQKVVDDTPIAVIPHKERYNVAIFFDMEQFQLEHVRGAYSKVITDCVEGMGIKSHFFKNFQDLKRRMERNEFTHLYISMNTYQMNQPYFDEISSKVQIMVVKEPSPNRVLKNRKLIEISKPFNLLPVVDALNHGRDYFERTEEDLEGYKAPNTNVLVVDDNSMNLLVAKRLLEEYEINVSTALSGKQAIKMLENPVYDLVFMDHMMPEMDGVETLHQIRNMAGSYYDTVPIVALTANAVAGSRQMFLEEGFDDFMEKPIDITILERKCRKYLPQRRFSGGTNESPIVQLKPVESALPQPEQNTQPKPEQSALSESVPTEESLSGGSVMDLKIDGVSVKDGLVYCRDEKIYSEMLIQTTMAGPDTMKNINRLFEEENWKDYIIAVHASKSAMKTVGAMKLSDICKELEMLGKAYMADLSENGNADTAKILKIRELHPVMLEVYRKLIRELSAYFEIEVKESDSSTNEKIEKTPEMTLLLEAFEDAAYDFDEAKMRELLLQITDETIKSRLNRIYQKLDKKDFISASESLNKLFV